MEHKELKKVFYANKDKYEEEYNARKNSPFSVSLDINIGEWEAFYVNLPEITSGISNIYDRFKILQELCYQLPNVAYERYARNCLIDEVMLTNDIEGIRSTRKEIIDVLENEDESDKEKRFDGLIKKYVLLLDESIQSDFGISLESCRDIRKLYDEIVLNEIDEGNRPDGEIFRKEGVEVISGTQKVKHRGVNPESMIIEYMEKGLTILRREDIPIICRIAIFHYILGYVHPFYDGNGRLSRFISSYLLRKNFNSLVALRLSCTIKDKKSEYYKAFDIGNETLNRGELTFFIKHFINIIQQSIDALSERLSDGADAVKYFGMLLEEKFSGKVEKKYEMYRLILWYLVQNTLFANEPFDKKELAILLNVSKVTSHKYVNEMIEEGIPVKIEKESKKNVYKIDLSELNEFLT